MIQCASVRSAGGISANAEHLRRDLTALLPILQPLESFYRKIKDAQAVTNEVAETSLPDLVLVGILLDAVEGSYSEFATLVESHLNHPTTTASQKTFEYVFARFRSDFYRAKAAHTSSTEAPIGHVGGKKQGEKEENEKCGHCQKRHGPDCWTLNPEKAPPDWREHYTKRHEKMKAEATHLG